MMDSFFGYLNQMELRQLIKQCEALNIITLRDLKDFVATYTDGTTRDILDKINGCYVYELGK